MKYEDLLELVEQRRSIRRFQTKPVPDQYIEKIIEVARWAPSGFNSQPWEFVVVRKEELKSIFDGKRWEEGLCHAPLSAK